MLLLYLLFVFSGRFFLPEEVRDYLQKHSTMLRVKADFPDYSGSYHRISDTKLSGDFLIIAPCVKDDDVKDLLIHIVSLLKSVDMKVIFIPTDYNSNCSKVIFDLFIHKLENEKAFFSKFRHLKVKMKFKVPLKKVQEALDYIEDAYSPPSPDYVDPYTCKFAVFRYN